MQAENDLNEMQAKPDQEQLLQLFHQLSVALDYQFILLGQQLQQQLFSQDSNIKPNCQINGKKQCLQTIIHQKTAVLRSQTVTHQFQYKYYNRLEISGKSCESAANTNTDKISQIRTMIRYDNEKFEQLNGGIKQQSENDNNLEYLLKNVPRVDYDPKMHYNLQKSSLFAVTAKRKQRLFRNLMNEQQKLFTCLKLKYQQKYQRYSNDKSIVNQGKIVLQSDDHNKHTILLTKSDFNKLNPSTYLNDTIINSYLKILQLKILNKKTAKQTYIFSSYLISKLLGDLVENCQMVAGEDYYQRSMFLASHSQNKSKHCEDWNYNIDSRQANNKQNYSNNKQITLEQKVSQKVRNNYQSVKRWAKNVDIFQKEYLVFPICAFQHWNCIIALLETQPQNGHAQPQKSEYLQINKIHDSDSKSQGSQQQDKQILKIRIKLFLLDSMLQMRRIFPQAVKTYLQILASQKSCCKKKIFLNITIEQLILPRQTNHYDCGVFTLCYIQKLLMKPKYIRNKYHNHLFLISRSLIYCMRSLLRTLLNNLLSIKTDVEANTMIRSYRNTIKRILIESDREDYDSINEFQFRKYCLLSQNFIKQKNEIRINSNKIEYNGDQKQIYLQTLNNPQKYQKMYSHNIKQCIDIQYLPNFHNDQQQTYSILSDQSDKSCIQCIIWPSPYIQAQQKQYLKLKQLQKTTPNNASKNNQTSTLKPHSPHSPHIPNQQQKQQHNKQIQSSKNINININKQNNYVVGRHMQHTQNQCKIYPQNLINHQYRLQFYLDNIINYYETSPNQNSTAKN